MPKRIIKRFMPDHRVIREHKHLRFFGNLLHDPNLWHLNRRSVSGAVAVGLFIAFVPVPFQMVIAAAIAIPSRVNLPIAASLTWITNPFTTPPILYLSYKLGTWLLNEPIRDLNFEVTFEWLATKVGDVWEPFLLGCMVFATLSAILGNLLIRGLWRLKVVKNWQARKAIRLQKKSVVKDQ
ncbi:MAG TPA: DUF2062 domain-containing protein [Gammaproteobacteria bacterium]